MATSHLMLGLCIAAAAGAAAPCQGDHHCSLNGVCAADGRCACDTPWSGESCGVLLTAAARTKGVYGYAPNISSWGGNIVQGGDGLFHLYVSEITDGGLTNWETECQCVHATSSTVSGPFEKADVSVAKWCHNAAPIRDPRGEYLLFHIGYGPEPESSGFMHHSASPSGPWLPAQTSPGSCNNPAPAFHPNGTLFMICDHMFITSASSWEGEWQPKRHLGKPAGDPDRNWEDPTLWFDRRGNFHILYHVFCLKPFAAHKECYSGHAFSADGFAWSFSDVEPFSGTVAFTDGTATTFSTRERPQVIFAPGDKTTPVGFVGGVSSQPIGSMCDSCYLGTCSQCKITKGRDWTYTVLQPLEGFEEAYPETGKTDSLTV